MSNLSPVKIFRRGDVVSIPPVQFREYPYINFKQYNRGIEWNNGTLLFKFQIRMPHSVNDINRVYKLLKNRIRDISVKNIVIVDIGVEKENKGRYEVEIYIKHPEHPRIIEIEDILSMVEFIFINN